MNVLLVGAGELGSRHLQSLLKVSPKIKITVVDESYESLSLAKSRAAEIKNYSNKEIEYFTSLEKIQKNHFFLTIVATGAAPRLLILKEILSRFELENIILEKFLFQDIESYSIAKSLIDSSSSFVYVNCPKRTYPFFKKLKKEISLSNSPLSMNFKGGEWVGLACNSIHYIDLLAFLGDVKFEAVDCSNIDTKIIPSKRVGHIEFTGTVIYKFDNNAFIKFQSIQGSGCGSRTTLRFGAKCYEIDEITGDYELYEGTTLIKRGRYDVPFQSDLTNKVFDMLIKEGTCSLPTYDESSEYHKIFLQEMLNTYNRITKLNTYTLPIT